MRTFEAALAAGLATTLAGLALVGNTATTAAPLVAQAVMAQAGGGPQIEPFPTNLPIVGDTTPIQWIAHQVTVGGTGDIFYIIGAPCGSHFYGGSNCFARTYALTLHFHIPGESGPQGWTANGQAIAGGPTGTFSVGGVVFTVQ